MKKLICIGFLTMSLSSWGQVSQKEFKQTPRNSAYLELGGVGKAMYSLNFDHVLTYSKPFSLALKAGIMFPSVDSEDAFRREYSFPVELAIRTSEEGYVEFAIGQVITPDQAVPSFEAPPFLRFGIRVSNENGGVLFRCSLVSNLLQEEFEPRLAFAIGYTF